MVIRIFLKRRWFIIAILLLSAALRFYKIDANLPNTYWHDENNFVETALRFGTGNFRPHTLRHGMLLPMVLFAEYGAYYLTDNIAGAVQTPQDFLLKYVTNPTNFYLISRMTVALFDMGGILLVYLIAIRLYNKRVANLSSLFYSLSLVPFIQSKYTKASALSSFLLLSAFLALVPLLTKKHECKKSAMRCYIIAGLLIGLAAAAKFYAIFGFVFVLLAHLFNYERDKRFFDIKIMLSAIFLVLGFFLGSPYALVNPHFFYASLSSLRAELFDTGMSNTWLLYFTDHLKNVVGSRILEVLMLTACVFFVFKRSKNEIVLLSYPVILYFTCMTGPGFAHYLIPAVPFLAVITASFLDEIFKKMSYRKANIFIAVIVFIAVTPSFLNISRFNALISKPDTRTLARYWIEKNIPKDSSILMEGCISTVPIQVPQLKGNPEALKRDLDFVRTTGGKGNIIKAEMELAKESRKSGRYNLYKAEILYTDTVKEIKPDYVVLSGYADMDVGEREYLRESGFYKKREKLYADLKKEYALIKTFTPYPALGIYFPALQIADFKTLETINPLRDMPKLLQGPEIKVYRRKD